jgi:NitT/TauT family transport system substrate-binding protein
MKKRVISLVLISAMALGLTACSGGSEPVVVSGSTAVSSSSATKQPHVGTLKVAWFPSSIKAALTSVAYSLGYFEDEGVTVESDSLQTTSDALTALQLGKVDVVPVGITAQLMFISQGSDFTIFGGSAMEGGAIITQPENADKYVNWNNWKGVKWATGRSYTGDFIVRDHLRNIGIDPDKDITVSDMDNDTAIIQAVAKGSSNVGYITSDGVSTAVAQGLKVITKVSDLDPGYPCCRQTATSQSLKNNRAAFVAYQRGLIRAYKVIQSDHETAIKVMMKLTGQNRDYVETGLYGEYASKYYPSPAKQKVDDFNQYLVKDKVVTSTAVKLDDHIDTGIFKEALNDIMKRYPNDPDYQNLKAFSDKYDK